MDPLQNILNGISPDQLKAAKSGDVDRLMNSLSPQDAAKLNKFLSDEEATKRLLNSAQAQQLIKAFLQKGGK